MTHLMGSASPLFDGAGHPRGAVGAFFDVTSHQKMEDISHVNRLTFWNSPPKPSSYAI